MLIEHLVKTPRRISVNSWSLRYTIGDPSSYGPDLINPLASRDHRQDDVLLQLPARLATFGIHTLELCHFHLPSLEKSYLAELRSALSEANVELFSLLIDAGDITDPQYAERDLAWIESWLDVAGLLGASRSRVIAGKSAYTPEAFAQSVRGMRRLSLRSQANGARLMTENWFPLLSTPQAVRTLLEQLNGEVGLCFDFDNWSGVSKYENLRQIVDLAESCHAKARFSDQGEIDQEDYTRCLRLTQEASFSGPYTLVYAGPHDEWQGLATEREIVSPYL